MKNKDYGYKTDEKIDKELKYIYNKSKKLLNTRTKGAKQHDKYIKIGTKLYDFVIHYERMYKDDTK